MYSLDAEVDADVERAKAVLALVEDQHLPTINRLQEEAVSVLLQVLYFFHQGRVQFLASDYRARLIEAHGQGVLPKKAPGPGRNRPPRVIQNIHVPAPNSEQARVDLTKEEGEDDEESMNSQDSGSSPHYTSGGEEDKANSPVTSSTQKKATRSSW